MLRSITCSSILRRAVALFFATAWIGTTAPAAAQSPPIADHRPPVDAPVADAFRPPADPFGPGNRGLEYATGAGDPVVASQDGVVIFAGRVGDTSAVTIRHDPRLVTTYTHLVEIIVERGERVDQGQRLGAARTGFHFGARLDGEYIDPASLFGRRVVRVRLVSERGSLGPRVARRLPP